MDELGLPAAEIPSALSGRLNADPERVERGLAQLVLAVVDLLRELMERQALRRMEGGSLDEDEIERLGTAFMKLNETMDELKDHFDLTDSDLEMSLGPLGNLT
jgi:Gas vesicle protein K